MFEMEKHEPSSQASAASFAAAVHDHHTRGVSLDRELIRNPSSTFFLRLSSESLSTLGLHEGDEVLVDRSLDPAFGDVCVVAHDGEHRIGVLSRRDGRPVLRSELETIPLGDASRLFGVVTTGIVHLRRR